MRTRCGVWHLGRVASIPAATEVELSFTGLHLFNDVHLHGLASHLPCNLESLPYTWMPLGVRCLSKVQA